jgi:hypothetical protein
MAIGPRRAQEGNRKVSRVSGGIIKAGVQTAVAGVKPRSLNGSEPRERRYHRGQGVNPGHWCKPRLSVMPAEWIGAARAAAS